MKLLLTRLKKLWIAGRSAPRTGDFYNLRCACGRVLRGQRLGTPQMVSCATCHANLFVLPSSPLPPVLSRLSGVPVQQEQRVPLLLWLLPILVTVLTLVILLVVYRGWIQPALFEPSDPLSATGLVVPATNRALEQAAAQARQAWLAGQFALALEQIQLAESLEARLPAPDQRRRQNLERLATEIRLYAHLSQESLEEILRQASGLVEAEWQARFRQRYQGQTILLDAELIRQPEGLELRYPLDLPGQKVILGLEDLPVLASFTFVGSQRVLLGAGLEDIRRLRENVWYARLSPARTALLTRPEPLAFCCPGLADEETRRLLQRQQELREKTAASSPGKK